MFPSILEDRLPPSEMKFILGKRRGIMLHFYMVMVIFDELACNIDDIDDIDDI